MHPFRPMKFSYVISGQALLDTSPLESLQRDMSTKNKICSIFSIFLHQIGSNMSRIIP
jgi:hypothetical protein